MLHVSRLEIFGFKSFMDRLVLPLGEGIIGVVGPNGCGKSNIVDALRWVLGETRASQLRGDVLEDVIFNGTDALRPLGLAEVTLTLRSKDGDIHSSVTKYNQDFEIPELSQISAEQTTRLKVVPNSLAAQVEVETVDTPKSTVHEIKSTSLGRFDWLKSVTEVQITRRLYRNGESEFFINKAPARLRDIKDFVRAVGLGARSYTIVAQGEVSRIVTAKPEERRLILEDAAGILGLRDKIAEAEKRLSETTANLLRLTDVISELERQVGSLKRQATRAKNRNELKTELKTLETKLFASQKVRFLEQEGKLSSFLAKLEAEEKAAVDLLEEATTEENRSRGTLLELDIQADSLRALIDEKKEIINTHARALEEKRGAVHHYAALILAGEAEAKRLEDNREALAGRETAIKLEISELTLRIQAMGEEANSSRRSYDQEVAALSGTLKEKRDACRAKDEEIHRAKSAHLQNQSSLKAIREQIIEISPAERLPAAFRGEKNSLLGEEAAIFADGLIVPDHLVTATQSILAERARYLVTQNLFEAARHHAKACAGQAQAGIGLFLRNSNRKLQISRAVPFKALYDLIAIQNGYQAAASKMLANVYLVDTVDLALQYFEQQKGESYIDQITLVTPLGEIITSISYFHLHHEGGIIQLRNKERSLSEQAIKTAAAVAALESERKLLEDEYRALEENHAKLVVKNREQAQTSREFDQRHGAVKGELAGANRLLEQAALDIKRLADQRAARSSGLQDLKGVKENAERELKALSEVSHAEDQGVLLTISEQFSRLEEERKSARKVFDAVREQSREIHNKLDGLRKEHSQRELEIQKIRLEMQHIVERYVAEFGDEAGESNLILSDSESAETKERIFAIRSRIQREGDVDPTTIEQYEQESSRLEPLILQKDDLERAIASLKSSIERLQETSRTRFMMTFDAVRKNFEVLIPKLYGGGRGDLVLTNPENPSESGVDIFIRPPGKKLKSIELLSGGEKALCATALIFAMFMERPSPLCVLDEVDAPLDDANLLRFLELVQGMSKDTQFMMITHNKQSMTVADDLIGVTMEQPGASRVLTVSLNEAMQQVA
jgi:chromosome segregation protein